LRYFLQFGLERQVVRHPTRQAETAVSPALQREPRLPHQGLKHRRLIAGAKVGLPLFDLFGRHFFELVAQARFESGETELKRGALRDGLGKGEGGRIALRGEFLHLRPAGIAEPEQFRALVEGLAGGVVHRRGEQRDAPRLVDGEQRGVAARDEQAEVRQQLRELFIEGRRIGRVQGDER